jgi:hypothetical protein
MLPVRNGSPLGDPVSQHDGRDSRNHGDPCEAARAKEARRTRYNACMTRDSFAIHRAGRTLAALVVAVVMVAAIAQQFVPHLQLPMQFADSPRRLPVPVAALFPVVSTIANLLP